MTRSVINAAICWILLGSVGAVADDADNQRLLAKLIASGQKTQERCDTAAHAWKAVHKLATDQGATVEIVNAPPMSRMTIDIDRNGTREWRTRIIARDDLWYVVDGDTTFKCRPFRASLAQPNMYLLLALSDRRYLTADALSVAVTVDPEENGFVTLHFPVTGTARADLKHGYNELAKIVDQLRSEQKPGVVATMRQLQDRLDHGATVRVEKESGLIVEHEVSGLKVQSQDFRWISRPNPAVFDTQGHKWDDRAGALASSDMKDVIAVCHKPNWRPGDPPAETDACLFDIKTAEMERIPFRFGTTMPGCFSKSRDKVFVSGLSGEDGLMGLFEIDLVTGINRRLGLPEMLGGHVMMTPAFSPDGETLAVLYKGGQIGLLEIQVMLVDISTGRARRLGKPVDTAGVSWMPDGDGLVLLRRQYPGGPRGTARETICRMNLDGRIVELRPGDKPLVLHGFRRILFQGSEDKLWRTCDLDGSNDKMLGNGLPKHSFATVSPDGKRVIMMRFGGPDGPRPVLVDAATGQSDDISAPAGFWAVPAWQ